ncbi:MAG TPA: FG-GAP-like repeat-containing protein, partial [Pyrinomonadaceae bacterium]|nr:FG-GAP-like repeat-containing protein [Pyrinomonadaceae bacterium]
MKKRSILGVFLLLALLSVSGYGQRNSSRRPSAKNSVVTNAAPGVVASPQSTISNVVISQVYGGGGATSGTPTYKFDYVELFNRSASVVSLNGWALQYGSALGLFGGTTGANIVNLPNVTLNPGTRYLVALGGAGTVGADLPVAADLSSTAISMSASSGKIVLTNTTTWLNCGSTASPCSSAQFSTTVDGVAYGAAGNGTAGNGEGGTSVNNGGALNNTQGGVRNALGCGDSDNNNNDFRVVVGPVPGNSVSAPYYCHTAGDFDGDHKTDFSIIRFNFSAGAVGSSALSSRNRIAGSLRRQRTFSGERSVLSAAAVGDGVLEWWIFNSANGDLSFSSWGDATIDFITPADFDGDGKTDVAVWRPVIGGGSGSGFWVIDSSTNTGHFEELGQQNDDPTIVGDYDGDGKADMAVFRCPVSPDPKGQCYYFYKGSLNNPNHDITVVPWGFGDDTDVFAVPGDFDGDGKYDYCLSASLHDGATTDSSNNLFEVLRSSDGNADWVQWGLFSDFSIPGDYDGDGKSDFMVGRVRADDTIEHWLLTKAGTYSYTQWGQFSTDYDVPGDYDGDGKTDIAIWRTDTQSTFWVLHPDGTATIFPWGTSS